MAASNFRQKGWITCSKIFLRNSKILCNKESNFLQRRSVSSNIFDIQYLSKEGWKFRNYNQKLFSIAALRGKSKLNNLEFVCGCMSTFQQQMYFRKKQAQCSVLVELSNKADIPHATSSCEQFGVIKEVYSYSGESENVYLLFEYDDEDGVKKLLSYCQCENISDAFAAFSRIVRFEKKFAEDTPKMTVNIIAETDPAKLKGKTASELIEDLYRTEKLSELNTRLRFFFCRLLKDSLSGLFPQCDVFPFGSSVNGIGRHGCDLDVMVQLNPPQVESTSEFSFLNKTCIGNVRDLQRKSVYALGDYFGTFLPGFASVKKILHARVPILKFKHKILGMECDLSVNNMSAILMSEMLYFCGEIDSRVRPLLYAVKKWAKEANVTYDAPGSWITNFGLSLLVVFFLQNRPVPIIPCLDDVVHIIGEEYSTNFHLEYLTPISDLQAIAASNTESVALLLKEFLLFLGDHPFKDKHISILSGVATQKMINCPIWVQYPLEEEKNVTKNVSQRELHDMCEKAHLSSKCLAANMQVNRNQNDLSILLGIANITKAFAPKKVDVSSFYFEDPNRKRNARRQAY